MPGRGRGVSGDREPARLAVFLICLTFTVPALNDLVLLSVNLRAS